MAKTKPKLTEVSTKVHDLLASLESDDRKKVVQSVFALLGESANGAMKGAAKDDDDLLDDSDFKVGPKAKRWMKQHGLNGELLVEVFHSQDGAVEVIATDVPGSSKQAQSRNCYLLIGIQELLRTEAPTFQDGDAVALCKHMRCYDSPNHSKVRKELGLSGAKKNGFTLTAPCLRDAAALIKEMAASE